MNNELSSKQIVYGSRRQYVERAPNLGMGHHGQHKCWSISKRPEHIKPRRRGNAARTRYCTPSTRRRPSTALLLRREGRKQEIARLFKVMSHEDLVASDIDHDGRVDEAEFVLL